MVDVNPNLCVGCQYCIAACPYRVRFYPSGHEDGGQCDFCRKTNLQAGERPRALSLPTKALTFGNLDNANGEISQLLARSLLTATSWRWEPNRSSTAYRLNTGR
ncbi:4Fe-4S binding protein [Shigella flexneri]